MARSHSNAAKGGQSYFWSPSAIFRRFWPPLANPGQLLGNFQSLLVHLRLLLLPSGHFCPLLTILKVCLFGPLLATLAHFCPSLSTSAASQKWWGQGKNGQSGQKKTKKMGKSVIHVLVQCEEAATEAHCAGRGSPCPPFP